MSAAFALTSVVYSSVKTAIRVRPLRPIMGWSRSQPTVYVHLRDGRSNPKIRGLGRRKVYPPTLVLARYGYNGMHLLGQ